MMVSQVIGRSAVIPLFCAALPAVAGDNGQAEEEISLFLKKTCHSLQLFASTPSAPDMRWIAQIPDATCAEAQKLTASAKETERTNYFYERSSRSGRYRSQDKRHIPAECIAEHRRMARKLFLVFELMGNTCARIFRERAGQQPSAAFVFPAPSHGIETPSGRLS